MTDGDITEDDVLNAMEWYGGSFAQALSRAFRRADPENFKRLKAAFLDIWVEYEDAVRSRRQGER
jgi:hypothetical protein